MFLGYRERRWALERQMFRPPVPQASSKQLEDVDIQRVVALDTALEHNPGIFRSEPELEQSLEESYNDVPFLFGRRRFFVRVRVLWRVTLHTSVVDLKQATHEIKAGQNCMVPMTVLHEPFKEFEHRVAQEWRIRRR